MTLQPIYRINNTFLRRLLVCLIVPPITVVFLAVLVPVLMLVDLSIHILKLVWKAAKVILITTPKNLLQVECEMFSEAGSGFMLGWAGVPPMMPRRKSVRFHDAVEDVEDET